MAGDVARLLCRTAAVAVHTQESWRGAVGGWTSQVEEWRVAGVTPAGSSTGASRLPGPCDPGHGEGTPWPWSLVADALRGDLGGGGRGEEVRGDPSSRTSPGTLAAVCARVGRDLAHDGVGIGEALDGLRVTWVGVRGGAPDFTSTRALVEAWSEESLDYLHQLSCEDPLTALATVPHLRARLSEVHRAASAAGRGEDPPGLALVVVEVSALARPSSWPDPFEATMTLVRLARTARTVFPGEETVARLRGSGLLVLARREPLLVRRVGLLRDLLADISRDVGRIRVHCEDLPTDLDAALLALDDLAQGS